MQGELTMTWTMRLAATATAAMLTLSGGAARAQDTSGATQLRVHGSNTIGAKLGPDLAKALAASQGLTAGVTKPGAKPEIFDLEFSKSESNQRSIFKFEAEGSGSAPTGLASGAADVGMMSRPINDKELAATAAAGLGDLRATGAENVIALDGLVVIVNRNNSVGALTIDQIARIFSGEIKDWAEVGGTRGPINIYARDNVSGTWDTFKSLVLDPGKRALAAGAKRYESSEELSDNVDGDVQGIGFIGFAYIRNAKPLKIATPCGLQFTPEAFGVRTEEYPLARRLYMYVPSTKKNDAAAAYIRFALSDQAVQTVDDAGFISLKLEQSSERYVADRAKAARDFSDAVNAAAATRLIDGFADLTGKSGRVSTTFRFETASDALDARSREDVRRVADYVKSTGVDPQRLSLVGFADPRGNFRQNLELSDRRAKQIAAALGRLGLTIPAANVKGFGIVAPVACSDGAAGLAKNRRVEVWVRR
jgi:phosphate transport system substrate-binding protein